VAERVVPVELIDRLGIGAGLTLVQHPVSPFCMAIQRLLDAAGASYSLHDVALWDRRPVIELTAGAYYSIPVLVDARPTAPVVVYEGRDDGQDIARYVDEAFGLGVFPDAQAGLHELLVQYVEGQVEDVGFRLNDAYFLLGLPDVVERTMYVRHKERKFGRGCVEQWRDQAPALRERLREVLTPLNTMLGRAPYLLGQRPVFADYALHGVLGNYTFTGDNRLPDDLDHLRRWYDALPAARLAGGLPAAQGKG
jgi:glutathione S-transferase